MPDGSVPLPNSEQFAAMFREALSERIGAARVQLWFVGQTKVVLTAHSVTITVRSEHSRDWLTQAFMPQIIDSANELLGQPLPVNLLVDPAQFEEGQANEAGSSADESQSRTGPRVEVKTAEIELPKARKNLFGEEPALEPPPRPRKKSDGQRSNRRWKSLADFVVGKCNRLAHACALSLIEDPGQGANPLVIHGPVGTGKTHLLEGIYAGLRKSDPSAKPMFVTAEEFTTRYVQSSRFNRQTAFRRQVRDSSALLIDDLTFLATKKMTQEEFLHIFDSFLSEEKQIVVTMDCHPKTADVLTPELADRLLGGPVCGLLPPDDETRLEILRKKSSGKPTIPDEVLKYIARSLRGNVRELEGAIHSVKHYARVYETPIDLEMSRECLAELLRHSVRAVTLPDIDRSVCGVLKLPNGALQSKARSWAVSHPRMLAIYLARKHTTATYGEIALYFGAKTHSSAVAAEKKVRTWISNDSRLTLGSRDWATRELAERIERDLLK